MTAISLPMPSAAAPSPLHAWLKWAVAGGLALAFLYLVFNIYLAGQIAWAAGVLVLGASGLYVYLNQGMLAYRYLFPGVAAMAVFVVFPLLYTAQIGFTNYSSAHLLSYERARDYLLDQREPDEARLMNYSLHAEGGDYRLLLTAVDGQRYVTPALGLRGAPDEAVALQPAPADASYGDPLTLKELLKHRDALLALKLKGPDGTELQYAGVREFAPMHALWKAQDDGALLHVASGQVYRANQDTGYFENARGEPMQPGFKVGIGLANYTRMLGDADFRGPFLSIFVWTVVFAGLTVVTTLIVGMTLAVLLNWEGLKYRTTYRTLLFLPYAVPAFISILVFKGLFNQNFGEINAILDGLFGVRPAWFADPLLAKAMILIVNTWLGYPYIMVLCTGLLKSIPSDLYEASALAGASPWTNFTKITAPLIIKPLTPVLIHVFAFNFNNLVLITLLTKGRPDFLNTKVPAGTTDILVSYTYRIAFQDSGQNFGLAAAISTLIFFMVAGMSLLSLKLTRANANSK